MHEARRTLRPEDVNLLQSPGDPQLSPDGRWVVWVMQSPETASDRQSTNIWIAAADGSGRPRPLTSSGTDRHPRWSPDGQVIALVSERSSKAQIWLIRPDGGEAWQLPTAKIVQSPPMWSPGGRRLAFVSKDFPHPEDWVPYAGAPDGDRERALDRARRRLEGERPRGEGNGVRVVTRLKHRFDGTGAYGDLRNQLFMVDFAGPGAQLQQAQQLTHGNFDHESGAWTPDGALVVAAVRRPDADRHPGGQLWLVRPGDDAPPKLLYSGTGPAGSPVVSPDGQFCAFLGHDNALSRSTTNSLFVISLAQAVSAPLDQAAALNLTAPADRPAGCPVSSDVRYTLPTVLPCWSDDSRSLYYLLGDGGSVAIVRMTLPNGWPGSNAVPASQPEKLHGDPGQVISSLDCRAGRLVYQAETANRPAEVYACRVTDPAGGSQISHAHDELLQQLQLAECEAISYEGADGWPVEGFWLRPPGAKSGPYPTVVLVHGGPHGVYGHAFMFQAQVLAAAGMAVLYTNPRGSQGYGQDFAQAVVGDWGGGDYQDIMAGVNHVVAAGVADPARLGLAGWSYGGYMTSWAISQSARFKAAVAGATIFNRHNFWGTSDIGYEFGMWHFGGTPWEDEDRLLARSPVRYAGQISTPLLLLHGEADLRCPIEQSEQFYQVLRFREVPVVMVRYPGEHHVFKKPSNRQDRFARTRAWFEHYLLA